MEWSQFYYFIYKNQSGIITVFLCYPKFSSTHNCLLYLDFISSIETLFKSKNNISFIVKYATTSALDFLTITISSLEI